MPSEENIKRMRALVVKYKEYAQTTFRDNPELLSFANQATQAFQSKIKPILVWFGSSVGEDSYTRGPVALKLIFKLIDAINKQSVSDQSSKEWLLLIDLIKKMKLGQYNEIITTFDTSLGAEDGVRAEKYFNDNPSAIYCGSHEGMLYSYIKNEHGEIKRRGITLGTGAFGRTKVGENHTEETTAIKRQSPSKYTSAIAESHWLPKVLKEAAINLDLQIARSGLRIRRDADGHLIKVYQDMRNLGASLTQTLKRTPNTATVRIDYAIDLLLKVSALHSGEAATSKKPYAHRDIKPDNILIDKEGTLHLIDFGITKDDDLTTQHCTSSGTPLYMPISHHPTNMIVANKQIYWFRVEATPSYFFDDKIATLRTIYSQLGEPSIISKAMFSSLPKPLQLLLETNDIGKCIRDDTQHTLKLITAAFILYKLTPSECTQDKINALIKDIPAQDALIASYQESKIKDRIMAVLNDAKNLQQESTMDSATQKQLFGVKKLVEGIEKSFNNDVLPALAKYVDYFSRVTGFNRLVTSIRSLMHSLQNYGQKTPHQQAAAPNEVIARFKQSIPSENEQSDDKKSGLSLGINYKRSV